MRLRSQIIGALNSFSSEPGALGDDDIVVDRSLAEVATIALTQHRAALADEVVNDELNNALRSRVLIEQAKAIIAERHAVDIEQAFVGLRSYARHHNQRLVAIAQDVVDGRLELPPPRPTSG